MIQCVHLWADVHQVWKECFHLIIIVVVVIIVMIIVIILKSSYPGSALARRCALRPSGGQTIRKQNKPVIAKHVTTSVPHILLEICSLAYC